MSSAGRDLPGRAIHALLWIAAFSLACGIFLSVTLLLRNLPPTPHVAVGRVTIENVSKLRDYLTALLFILLVPPVTILLHRYGTAVNDRLRRAVSWRDRSADGTGIRNVISLSFLGPFLLAPFLYLTTFKWGWPLLIPLLMQLLTAGIMLGQRKRWLRQLFRREMQPTHALILANALAWILFRYIAVSSRIAHIPTLFLEVVFVGFFLFVFWAAFVLIARLAAFTVGLPFEIALRRLAIAGMPLLVLPLLGILFLPAHLVILLVLAALLVAVTLALRASEVESPQRVRRLAAYLALPFLLFCFSYASTASLTQWIDLFHRGESLGPASDYLRGKVPYRDVFVLHGLMHDGMLDAWLMRLFGRDLEVAIARPAILGSLAAPALWYLGMAIFDSIPLSILVMLLGAVTTVDNERILFEISALALLLAGTRTRMRWPVLALSGVASALALFFSFDIGLYCIGGALLYFAARSAVLRTIEPMRGAVPFLCGALIGAAPFLIFLAVQGALGPFLRTSFVTIPRIIDAVWSLPFPDMSRTFRRDLNLHTISEFLLFEHFRYILNPLVICISVLCIAQRALRRKVDGLTLALLALTAFALLTQRSALGRADFPHQYFSAFLIGPMILVLVILFARDAAQSWRGDRSAQAFYALLALAALPLFSAALWVPDLVNLRIDDLARYGPRVKGFLRDPLAEEVRGRIDSVRYHVFDLTPRQSPIFDFSNQPAFYFFLNRPNPTRFYQIPILSPPEFQRETIEALMRSRPSLVIRRSPQLFDAFDGVDNNVRAQAVAAYIDDHYAYARSVRGVELWTRKRAPGDAGVDAYLRHIRVPTSKELTGVGARTRLLFPSIGSTPGANNSFWRSDLVLHNTFRDPLHLSLRYVAGETRIDRRVTLGGGRTIRWEDVVKSLFAAPDSRGVLWIEYRGERGPVARVRTYDATRNAGGSVESPLTLRDSAAAGTDRDDLTIVGLPGGGAAARRVNVGVINVGDIPATYRVTVRRRDGRLAGRPFEEGLPEDESVLIDDAERRLGAAIDENSAVHVTMIAGTAVAYATVVETDGDNHFLPAVPSPRP